MTSRLRREIPKNAAKSDEKTRFDTFDTPKTVFAAGKELVTRGCQEGIIRPEGLFWNAVSGRAGHSLQILIR